MSVIVEPMTPGYDSPPANLAFGIGGVDFLPLEAIGDAQTGYGGPDWRPDWLVIAIETACGDPLFVDRSHPGSPVFTAMHGMGSWDSSPVAPSWHAFVRAVEAIRPYTKGREGPRGLRENPLTSEERVRITAVLQEALGVEPPGFWHLLLDDSA